MENLRDKRLSMYFLSSGGCALLMMIVVGEYWQMDKTEIQTNRPIQIAVHALLQQSDPRMHTKRVVRAVRIGMHACKTMEQ